MEPHISTESKGIEEGEMAELLKLFEGCWEALPIFLFIKTNGDGNYHLNEMVQQSGIGKYRLKQLFKLMAEAGLIQYSLTRGKGLKLALLSQYSPNKVNFAHLKLALCTKGKGTKRSKAPGTIDESRLSLTDFRKSLQCELRSPIPGSAKALPRIPEGSLPTYAAKETPPSFMLEAQTNCSDEPATETGPRQGAVQPKSEEPSPKPKKTKKKKAPKEKTLGGEIWDAYAAEYEKRYGFIPPRGAANNTHTKALGEQLGRDAIEVARFFVWHTDQYYIKNRHAIPLLRKDTQRVYGDWKIGSSVSTYDASQTERYAATDAFFQKLKEDI